MQDSAIVGTYHGVDSVLTEAIMTLHLESSLY